MRCGEITESIIGCAFDVHNDLGAGFLENVYENALVIALAEKGHSVQQQPALQVHFRGRIVGEFRPDLLVDDAVVVEIKAQASLVLAHEAQLLNYLRATGKGVGLLINFGRRVEYQRRVL
jgi:GxxExxY protein